MCACGAGSACAHAAGLGWERGTGLGGGALLGPSVGGNGRGHGRLEDWVGGWYALAGGVMRLQDDKQQACCQRGWGAVVCPKPKMGGSGVVDIEASLRGSGRTCIAYMFWVICDRLCIGEGIWSTGRGVVRETRGGLWVRQIDHEEQTRRAPAARTFASRLSSTRYGALISFKWLR